MPYRVSPRLTLYSLAPTGRLGSGLTALRCGCTTGDELRDSTGARQLAVQPASMKTIIDNATANKGFPIREIPKVSFGFGNGVACFKIPASSLRST